MTQVSIRKELIANHSTEEVVSYINSELSRVVLLATDVKQGESFRLGVTVQSLGKLLEVINELDKKLNHVPPTVV